MIQYKDICGTGRTQIIAPIIADASDISVTITHEEYIHAVRDISISRLNNEKDQQRLLTAKLTYGSGQTGVRGTCYYKSWENGQQHEFIEISAASEESNIQLAGTTIHELAHCLAGFEAGHGRDWKKAAKLLGLIHPRAAGQEYRMTHFDPEIWASIQFLPLPSDGKPTFNRGSDSSNQRRVIKIKPCHLGIGTRGGQKGGIGSGSRLRLFICSCEKPVKVRVGREIFSAMCLLCKSDFRRAD